MQHWTKRSYDQCWHVLKSQLINWFGFWIIATCYYYWFLHGSNTGHKWVKDKAKWPFAYVWDKVFKNRQGKICGRQTSKILKVHGLPKVDHTPSNLRLSSTIFTSYILEYFVSNVTQDLL